VKILFVGQRYGNEVLGGSEAMTRFYASRLAARGHEVHVLTSCATSYLDWANQYAPGDEVLEGVTVHRLPVLRPRDLGIFGRLSDRVLSHPQRVPLHLQKEWMRLQGPLLPDLEPWLVERSAGFDVVSFMTYLYFTTWAGLAASQAPSILFPTAHDEPPLALPLFDGVFRMPNAFGFMTEEEATLVDRRFHVTQPSRVVGIGVEPVGGDVAAFRRRFGLFDRPYLVYAGRIDPNKGAVELAELFARYKTRRPGPLTLVMIGEELVPITPHADVVKTGFVDTAMKDAGIAGAALLVQPSYFESFSIVLGEAWALGVPALVQGKCEVLAGQVERSGGGIPYRGYPQFEAALDRVLSDEALRRRLAAAGREYVRERYTWNAVLGRLEELLRLAAAGPSGREADAAPERERDLRAPERANRSSR